MAAARSAGGDGIGYAGRATGSGGADLSIHGAERLHSCMMLIVMVFYIMIYATCFDLKYAEAEEVLCKRYQWVACYTSEGGWSLC
jgi:hypothetical protein